MRAMVLCAGLGTRLRPLTNRWPKPAIPLLGAPLLRYHLATLKAAGVTEVGINTFHLPEVMEAVAAAECARAGMRLEVNREVGEIQGTGGGIRGLRRFLRESDPFVVVNGDILFAVDLPAAVTAHRASGAAATMVLLPMPEGEKFAAVECSPDFEVRRIAGHGPGGPSLSPWHFTGVHVMSPAVLDAMSPSGPEDINRQVYPRMMERGLRVGGTVARAYWSDLGTPSRYLAAQRDLLFGQVPVERFPGASPFDGAAREGNAWVRAGARVEGGVAGPALFDEACAVARGASVGSAVYVGPRAEVATGARLNRVAVLEGTRIAGGEELVEAIAWGAERIPAPL
ncbi:MAG TPA: NDP-sugar synthase [Myxococcaceae bacterium]|jgi:mannose-1-phosphate guanylyltransferase